MQGQNEQSYNYSRVILCCMWSKVVVSSVFRHWVCATAEIFDFVSCNLALCIIMFAWHSLTQVSGYLWSLCPHEFEWRLFFAFWVNISLKKILYIMVQSKTFYSVCDIF